jgi:hypothetical protein
MGKQIFRKELSRKVNNHVEEVTYEYYAFTDLVSWEEIQAVCDILGYDPDAAYANGIGFDFNDDLCYMEIDSFLLWLEDYMKNTDAEDQGSEYKALVKLGDKLKKYVGFTVWL